jgi:monofunctional biosynthetic peptidoglycan transglycosylase
MSSNILRSQPLVRWRSFACTAVLLLFAFAAADLWLTWWRHRDAITALGHGMPNETAYMRRMASQGHPPKARIWAPLDSVATVAVCAVLASEDYRFFSHGTTDPVALSLIIHQVLRGDFTSGGSTISQQLARNLFLSPERTPWRKLREYVLARDLSHRLSKERQLELYLNLVEWGPGIWGIGSASRRWFGKSPTVLTAVEAVVLTAILPSPEHGLRHAAVLATSVHRRRILRRLWLAGLLDGVTRGATAARLDRWAFHLHHGRTPAEALALVRLEMGPEGLPHTAVLNTLPWSHRCRPKP